MSEKTERTTKRLEMKQHMYGVETLFNLQIFLSPYRFQSSRNTLQLLDLLGEVGGFEGIIVAIGMFIASPLANKLLSIAMMRVFSPH